MGVLRAKVGGEWVDIQTGIPASQLLVTEEAGANYPNASTITFRSGFDLSGGGGVVNVVLDLSEYTGAALPLASGGTGATTQADARTALGLGTMAVRANVGTTDLQDNAVNNAKLADIAVANRIKGAVTIGDPQDLNPVQVRSIISSDASSTGTPNTLFFRGDGIWAIPAPGIDVTATQDVVGSMFTSGSHSRISAVYDKPLGRINLAFVDSNLITISGLTPTAGNVIQSVGGTWASQTPAQLKTTLALTKTDVGLNLVDNTTDLDKPISTLTQTALNGKQPIDGTLTALAGHATVGMVTMVSADTFTGRSVAGTTNRIVVTNGNGVLGNPTFDVGTDVVLLTGAQILTGKTLNSPVINSPTGIAKGDVGLGNVDNTSDVLKPVSTAQAAADLLRVLKTGDTMTGALTIPNGTIAGHAVNKGQLDAAVDERVAVAGDVMTGTLGMSNQQIYGLGAGTAADHAIRKDQLDTINSSLVAAIALKFDKAGGTITGNTTFNTAVSMLTTLGVNGVLTAGSAVVNGALVVNETGIDADTRIEGDTDINLLFVDASTDRVGIGTALPAFKFDVTGDGRFTGNVSVLAGTTALHAVNKTQLDLKFDKAGGSITGATAFTAAAPVTMGSTLGVTGLTTLAGLNAGASTLASLGVTGAATVGSTLGVTGRVTAAAFTGDGALLTALNATEITTGTLNRARLPPEIDANTTGWSKRWETGRLVSFGGTGDITGAFTIRGDADVANVVLTISPNSVALGNDTTGNYVTHIIGTTNRVTSDTVTAAEGTTHTLTLPQDIHTGAMPRFNSLTLDALTGPPMTIGSQALVTNLNAQYLNSQAGSYYLNAGNLTGLIHADRVDGPYAKITRVGTLDQLTVTGASVFTGTTSFSQTPTVAGETMWHSGNDGHTGGGTGINADLLDGFHADYFAVDSEVEALMGDLLSVGLYDPASYNNENYTLRFDRAQQQALTGLTIAAGDHPFDMRFELDMPVITQAELATTPRRRIIRNGVQLDIVRTGDDDHLNRTLGLVSTPKNANLYINQSVVLRAKLRKTDLDAPGIRQIARHGSSMGPYLAPTVGIASTPDTADMAITGRVRFTFATRINTLDATFPSPMGKYGSGAIADRELLFYNYPPASTLFSTATTAGTQNDFGIAENVLGEHVIGVEVAPGSVSITKIMDGVRTPATLGGNTGLPNTAGQLTIGSANYDGRIYWAQMETINRARFVFPGVAGNYLSVPHSSAFSGDLEIVVRVSFPVWPPSANNSLAIKWGVAAADQSFGFMMASGGAPHLFVGTTGGSSTAFAGAGPPMSANVLRWLRVSRAVATGTVRFYSAPDSLTEPTTWTQYGSDSTPITGTLRTSSQEIQVGARQPGGSLEPANARIARTIIRNGTTTLLDVDENNVVMATATTFPATTGQTVTVAQTGANVIVQPQADTLVWRFDASERTGTGTSYTDPRGRTWTMANANAVVAPPPDEAWTLYMDTGKLSLRASSNGTATSTVDVLSAAELDAIVGTADNTDFYVAAAIAFGPSTLDVQGWGSTDGEIWTSAGAPKSVSFATKNFYDSPGGLSIGGADAGQFWDGRIYWVDMMAGITPTTSALPIWRFAATDHPYGGGTSYNSPRGHTWTLSRDVAIAHAALNVHATITTNVAARTAISPVLSNTLAAGQKYQVRGSWNASTDQVSAAWRDASVLLDDNVLAWNSTSTTFAGETMATPGAVVIGQATPASPNLSYGGAMYRILIEKNFATILDLVPKNNISTVGEETEPPTAPTRTIAPTVGPPMTLSHYSMMTSTKPHPQWDKGPNVYWHNSYWICRSSGQVDFIDSDYSGRYDPTTDKVVSLANGDWVIGKDKDFGAPGHEQGTPQPYSQMVFQYIPFSSETYVKAQISDHTADVADPHSAAGYLKDTVAKTKYSPIVHMHEAEISGWINLHKQEVDPHPGYLTETEANGLFLTPAEGDLLNFEPKGEVEKHEHKPNPHPDYLTEAEGIAAFAPAAHPHPEYAREGHTHNFDDEVASSDGAESARIFVGETTPANAYRGDLWVQTYNISLTAPTAPTNLLAAVTSSSVTLTWAPWPTAAAQNAVRVEWSATGADPQAADATLGWTLLVNDTTSPYDVTYVHTGRAERVRYWYRVRATNVAGAGAWGFVDATIPNTPPPPPAPVLGTITTTSIQITWPAVTVVATDPLHAQPYEVFKDSVSQGFTAALNWTFSGLTQNATHTLGVRTRDSLGALSATVSITGTVNNADPPAPTGLYAVGVNHHQFHMGWSAVTGIPDFSRYQVFVNGGYWADTTSTDYLFSDNGLAASGNYNFQVRSVDTRNAVSGLSTLNYTLSVNPDTTPPPPLTGVGIRPQINYGRMVVNWNTHENNVRNIVYYNVNGAGWNVAYDGVLNAGNGHAVHVGTWGGNNTIYAVIHQYDSLGNVRYGDQVAYTIVPTPTVFAPTGSNTYRANGEWGVVGSKKLYQGYYNNAGLNAYGCWFYGRQFQDWYNSGRTYTALRIFANREGCGVNQEDNIWFWKHTHESDPGMGFGLGAPYFHGGPHNGGTLHYNDAKWMNLPVNWVFDLCTGAARGIGIHTGYYVCLRPANDAYSGGVEVHHLG